MAARPRLTVLNAFAVHPPSNGGTYRIHWIYRTLARHFDIDLVTLGLAREGAAVIQVQEGLRELRVPRTAAHEKADLAAQRRSKNPVYDITSLANIQLTPDYATVLGASLARADVAVLTHPYMAEALRRSGYKGPFVHESHNHERRLKESMLPDEEGRERLLDLVEEAERFCCREAALVTAVSEGDARDLLEHYGGRPEDMIVIPNGTDTASIAFMDGEERRKVRRRVGLEGKAVALFLASGHRPNLEAAEKIIALAKRMPEVGFALVGNAADAFSPAKVPRNVWLVGVVEEGARNVWMHVAGVALNPMLYGGGTNLKLLDYFSAGTPVVTTEIGVRGAGARDGEHVLIAPAGDMEQAIRTAIAGGPDIERMTRAARALVEREFDWRALGERMYEAMKARGLAG